MTTEQFYNITPTQEKILMRKAFNDKGKKPRRSRKARTNKYLKKL